MFFSRIFTKFGFSFFKEKEELLTLESEQFKTFSSFPFNNSSKFISNSPHANPTQNNSKSPNSKSRSVQNNFQSSNDNWPPSNNKTHSSQNNPNLSQNSLNSSLSNGNLSQSRTKNLEREFSKSRGKCFLSLLAPVKDIGDLCMLQVRIHF